MPSHCPSNDKKALITCWYYDILQSGVNDIEEYSFIFTL